MTAHAPFEEARLGTTVPIKANLAELLKKFFSFSSFQEFSEIKISSSSSTSHLSRSFARSYGAQTTPRQGNCFLYGSGCRLSDHRTTHSWLSFSLFSEILNLFFEPILTDLPLIWSDPPEISDLMEFNSLNFGSIIF